jgi:hypothetical protein
MISMDTNFPNPRWRIPTDKFALLSEALKADRGPLKITREQRALIRTVCSSPEVRGVPPEHFFVSCKQALNIAANDLKLPLGHDRDDLISRLFSVCVEEFFQGDCGTEIRPSADRIKLSVPRRVIGSAAQPRDEDCRGAR